MKRLFFITLLILMSAAIAFPSPLSAANEVLFDDPVTLQLPVDGSLYTVATNGKVNTFTVSNDQFSFDLTEGSIIEITSADRKKLTNSLDAPTICQADNTYVKLQLLFAATTTVTVTPSGAPCSTGGGGSGGGGGGSGGGGGGGGSSSPAPAPAPAPLLAQAAPVSPAAPSVTAEPSLVITRLLTIGSEGDDVRLLQEYLAGDPEIYPGGTITGFFGPLTRAAVQRFQQKYGIAAPGDQGYGLVGPKTRDKLRELTSDAEPAAPAGEAPAQAATPALPVEAAPAAEEAIAITRSLSLGSEGDDVRSLQEYLAQDPELYPEGTASGFFGPLTRRAIQRFQEKYGIAAPGDQGYGLVGPKTRDKLRELTSGAELAPAPAPAAETPVAAPPAPAAGPSEADIKAQEIFKQIQEIQEQINRLKQQ